MQRLLKENPGETFLIEGHTDAVGVEVARLALSDQRAEAVATALTNVFDIAPENMETQGYGEQYLKSRPRSPSARTGASRSAASRRWSHPWRAPNRCHPCFESGREGSARLTVASPLIYSCVSRGPK